MDKFIILVSKSRSISQFSNVSRTFTDETEMERYIDLKTKAGYHCHKFDYDKTFRLESALSHVNINQP